MGEAWKYTCIHLENRVSEDEAGRGRYACLWGGRGSSALLSGLGNELRWAEMEGVCVCVCVCARARR